MNDPPAFQIREVRSQWHVVDAHDFDATSERTLQVVGDALASATGERVLARDGLPYVALRRAASAFDLCEVSVAVTALDESRSRVVATVMFDVSERRLDAVLMLGASVIGIPAVFAWRALSIRDSRRWAKSMHAALWKSLDDLTRASAYR